MRKRAVPPAWSWEMRSVWAEELEMGRSTQMLVLSPWIHIYEINYRCSQPSVYIAQELRHKGLEMWAWSLLFHTTETKRTVASMTCKHVKKWLSYPSSPSHVYHCTKCSSYSSGFCNHFQSGFLATSLSLYPTHSPYKPSEPSSSQSDPEFHVPVKICSQERWPSG